jgi:hypothetical protein
MRRREPLDPAVEAELAAIDAALAGTADADAELAALVRDLRAAAPRPAAAARAALDARVASGFAPEARRAPGGGTTARPRLRRVLRRRDLVPALAAAAAALVVVVVLAGLDTRGQNASSPAPTATSVAAPERGGADSSAGAAGGAGSGAGVAPPAGTAPVAPSVAAPGRRVERTVRLDLGARADRFDAVTDGVVRATQQAGGFVADSQIRREGGRGTATFVLRIPAARLDAAISGLSRLAHVRAIEQGATDLTGATDGTAARLADARTRRRALVAALATASGARAARLRGRLAGARARERSLDRALRALRARTAYATVDLTVTAPRGQAAAPAAKGRWTPADAWRDARRALEVGAGVLILVLAVVLPLALVGGLGAAAAGAVRRRRREAALDVV